MIIMIAYKCNYKILIILVITILLFILNNIITLIVMFI